MSADDDRLAPERARRATRAMLAWARPRWRAFAFGGALVAVTASLDLAAPWLTMLAIDRSLLTTAPTPMDARYEALGLLALALAAIALARAGTSYAQGVLLQRTGNSVMADLRRTLCGRLLRLPPERLDREPVGRLVTRATNDVAAVNEFFASVLVYAARDAIALVGAAALMLTIDWRLALVVLAFAPAVVAVSWSFRKRAREAHREGRAALAEVNARLQEAVSGIRAIQLAGQQQRMHARFEAANDREFAAGMRQVFLRGVYMPAIALVGTLALAAIVWYGGALVAGGALTVGGLVAFTGYVEKLFAPLRDLAEKHAVIQSAAAGAERLLEVLEAPLETAGGERPERCAGRIAFEGVSFAYGAAPVDGTPDPAWTLHDISFTAEPGQRIALVGPTGSGKTTLVSLLLRMREPQRGRITVDGIDIRALDAAWLRSRSGVVPQEPFIAAASLAENIALRAPIDRARVAAAATAAGLDALVLRLPEGLDATLGERGTGLSAGERQLVACARALAADPAILVLDEATASVDSETERALQTAMARLLEGRTAIVVAHRLSTIRHADLILVLRHGRIVERGRHDELLAHGGLYAALVKRHQADEAVVEAERRVHEG